MAVGVTDGRSENHRKIYAAVKRVPAGRVATYGQIAEVEHVGLIDAHVVVGVEHSARFVCGANRSQLGCPPFGLDGLHYGIHDRTPIMRHASSRIGCASGSLRC